MEVRTDAELVQEVRNGNRQAFTELMRRYQERVYWTARRIVGGHDDAEDVAQETFVRAYLNLGEFRAESAFFTWLYRIAVNLSLNQLRKRQVVQYLRESDLLSRFVASERTPASEFEFRETEARLHAAVQLLPERQKAVFVLRFFDGLSYDEIAEILKTSVGGLKANYFHALRKIREAMRDEVPQDSR
ncbi:MAG: polymerase, sigma-24 subunit, subfamily [Bacteroidetes bacterium]|nr:polymerase, sigma-24 subunit, subfamily [Bacteroidota bacterium]